MYEREMQDPIDDPPDAEVPAEFKFGRLRYPSARYGRWKALTRTKVSDCSLLRCVVCR